MPNSRPCAVATIMPTIGSVSCRKRATVELVDDVPWRSAVRGHQLLALVAGCQAHAAFAFDPARLAIAPPLPLLAPPTGPADWCSAADSLDIVPRRDGGLRGCVAPTLRTANHRSRDCQSTFYFLAAEVLMPRRTSDIATGAGIVVLSAACAPFPPRHPPSAYTHAYRLRRRLGADSGRRASHLQVAGCDAVGLAIQRASMTAGHTPVRGCRHECANKHSSWWWLVGLLIYGPQPGGTSLPAN